MARITLVDANAWSEKTKLEVVEFDDALLSQVETQVLSALANSGYTISTWVDATTTPPLVKSVIAMLYYAWFYDRSYSEDVGAENNYANQLREIAAVNVAGIVDGTFVLDGLVTTGGASDPSFYPNDNSSLLDATDDDPSLGGPMFSMGRSF